MADASNHVPVIVVGAGPTGLVLALWLNRYGIPVRIIDRASGPGLTSRAMAIQARTLELYRQFGLDEDIVARGLVMPRIHFYSMGREVSTLELGDFGCEISPFPFVLSLPQDVHERILGERLGQNGLVVEWDTELLNLDQNNGIVRAHLRTKNRDFTLECSYLCGCDGVHSRVREVLNIGFEGGTYEGRFFVADVERTGANQEQEFRGHLAKSQFYGIFPIRTSGMSRIIGMLPKEFETKEQVEFDDVRPFVEKTVDLRFGAASWFSVYRVHHRLAERFRCGRVFLLGDAGHVHSPAGGQGMNTGIHDSVNLGWKLAAVIQRRASELILDTYEAERIRFARGLVNSTDRAFKLATGAGFASSAFRTHLVPKLLPTVMRFPAARRTLFLLVSQVGVEYRESAMSCQGAGDRLPWLGNAGLDNHHPLKSMNWQVHVYGNSGGAVREPRLPLHVFPWSTEASKKGLPRNVAILVRPDGYIACIDRPNSWEVIPGYLDRLGISFDTRKASSTTPQRLNVL